MRTEPSSYDCRRRRRPPAEAPSRLSALRWPRRVRDPLTQGSWACLFFRSRVSRRVPADIVRWLPLTVSCRLSPLRKLVIVNTADECGGAEVRSGYTRAANHGLRLSSADFVILLDSDTTVAPRIEKLRDASTGRRARAPCCSLLTKNAIRGVVRALTYAPLLIKWAPVPADEIWTADPLDFYNVAIDHAKNPRPRDHRCLSGVRSARTSRGAGAHMDAWPDTATRALSRRNRLRKHRRFAGAGGGAIAQPRR